MLQIGGMQIPGPRLFGAPRDPRTGLIFDEIKFHKLIHKTRLTIFM